MLRCKFVCLEQHLSEDGLQQEGGQRRVGKGSPNSSRNGRKCSRLGTRCRSCLWGEGSWAGGALRGGCKLCFSPELSLLPGCHGLPAAELISAGNQRGMKGR